MRATRARPRSGRFVCCNHPLGKDRPHSPLRTPRRQPRCAGEQLERPSQLRPPWEAAGIECDPGVSAPTEVPNLLPSVRTPARPACLTTVDPSPRRSPVASRCASADPPSWWPSADCTDATTKLGWASTPSPRLPRGIGPKAKNRAEASPQRRGFAGPARLRLAPTELRLLDLARTLASGVRLAPFIASSWRSTTASADRLAVGAESQKSR